MVDNILDGKTIVVVDDEIGARKLLDLAFTRTGAIVYTAPGYVEGMTLLESTNPDLMLIDMMMPEVDGLTMCREVREISNIPIIIVTARDHPDDIVAGLQAGADDYVGKPFESKVLIERSKAVLRRGELNGQIHPIKTFNDGYLCIDLKNQVVTIEGQPVKLSKTEYDLLALMVRNVNHTCTFDQIMKYVWGQDRSHRPQYIHVYIWRLRQKLEKETRNPNYIITDHTTGYRFVFPVS